MTWVSQIRKVVCPSLLCEFKGRSNAMQQMASHNMHSWSMYSTCNYSIGGAFNSIWKIFINREATVIQYFLYINLTRKAGGNETETETMDSESIAHHFRHQTIHVVFPVSRRLRVKYRSSNSKSCQLYRRIFPDFFSESKGHLFLITVIICKSSFPCPTFNPNPAVIVQNPSLGYPDS